MTNRTTPPKPVAVRPMIRPGFHSLRVAGWCLVLAGFTSQLAASPLRIYIVTDLEGASGVYQFSQTREPGHPLGEKAKEYLMGDIAAVVRGLRAAQVTEIVVLDGHGSQAFVPHLMESGAKYIAGKPHPGPLRRRAAFGGCHQAMSALQTFSSHPGEEGVSGL